MFTFNVILSMLMIVMNFFIFVCFLSKIEFFKKSKIIIFLILVVISFLEVVYIVSLRKSSIDVWQVQILASLVGITFLLFCFSFLYLFFRVPLEVIPFDKNRRMTLKFILDVTIVITAFSYIFKALVGGFSAPKKRIVDIRIKNLSSQISIAQITDAHIGRVLGIEFMQEIVDKTNELNADIVVITGDLVDLPIAQISHALEPLKDLKSRFGVYYVAGNHEYFHGVKDIIAHLETLGIVVLKNDSVEIDNKINLVGVYDLSGDKFGYRKPDLFKALSKVNPDLPTVLLSHQPKIAQRLNAHEKIDLIISGHTHGGQIFPFGFVVLLDQPYLYGLYKHNLQTQVYVSSGVGYWGPPLRIFAPSEVVKLNLIPEKKG